MDYFQRENNDVSFMFKADRVYRHGVANNLKEIKTNGVFRDARKGGKCLNSQNIKGFCVWFFLCA